MNKYIKYTVALHELFPSDQFAIIANDYKSGIISNSQTKVRIRNELQANKDQVWTLMNFESTIKRIIREIYSKEIK